MQTIQSLLTSSRYGAKRVQLPTRQLKAGYLADARLAAKQL